MRLRNIPGAKETIQSSPFVVQNPAEQKGQWEKVFPKKQPIHIEVGMGKGRFLMDMARLHPEINYVGIEMYDSVLLRAVEKMEEMAEATEKMEKIAEATAKRQDPERNETGPAEYMENLKFMCVDARLLPEIFAEGEVEKIYLNFSDPWPKARHGKRRLTSREFLARYDQILASGGVVEFKTDNKDLFTFSLEEVEETKWRLLAHTFDLHHDEELRKGNVMTEYEEKFSSAGNAICKMIITR